MLGLNDGRRERAAERIMQIIRGGGRRGIVVVMALSLVLGGSPTPLWADEVSPAPAVTDGQVATSADNAAADAAGEPAAGEVDAPASDTGSSATAAAEPSAATTTGATSVEASPDASSDAASTSPAARAAASATAADWIAIKDASTGAAPTEAAVGQTLRIDATYEDPYGDFGDEAEFADAEYDDLAIQWYQGSERVSNVYLASAWEAKGYTPIAGAQGRSFTVTTAQAGSFIAARVTNADGSVVWSSSSTPQVPQAAGPAPEADADAEALAVAVAVLKADGFSGYYPSPRYGVDTNLNAMIEARLAALGHEGITARVSSVEAGGSDPAAAGGIDTSDTDANGAITPFFLAPDQKTSSLDYSVLRRFTPTFELSRGSAKLSYTPGRTSALPWDDAKVESFLEDAAAGLALPEAMTSGSVPEDVAELALPVAAMGEGGVKVADITWSSSDTATMKVATGFDSDYQSTATARFTHQSTPATVTLTAKLSLKIPGYGAAPEKTATRSVTFEVAPRSGASSAQIERRLKAYLSKVKATDFATGAAVDASVVTGDLQFSRPRDLSIDGKYYKLAYTSSDESVISVSGYRGQVTPSLAGESLRFATVTAHLTYEGVTVDRALGTFTMGEVSGEEIDAAVALMDAAKTGYAAHILGANAAPDEVTTGLVPFSAVLPGADGTPVWARTVAEAGTGGITAVDLPGYDSMSGLPWRAFRSSDERVVASESLRVTRPAYDTEVTVDSLLTYKRYESLALAHPENAQLAKLIAQPVSATFTVKGTKGAEDPEAARQVSATVTVTGLSAPDAEGSSHAELWVPPTKVTFKKSEARTAWDLIASLLDQAGYTYDATTFAPDSITSLDGRTLGMEQVGSGWSYWSFYVNGAYAQAAANKTYVADGDEIALTYVSATPQVPGKDAPEINPDAPRPNAPSTWSGFGNGGTTALAADGAPTGSTRERWTADLKATGESFTAVGDPIIVGDRLFVTTSTDLVKIDRATGEIVARVKTFGHVSYFSRPVYARGVVIVPSDDGSLAAFTADTLTCVWKTPSLAPLVVNGKTKGYQAASTLAVAGDAVIAPFVADVGASGAAQAGALVAVRISDGAVLWTNTDRRTGDELGAGYYWAGAAPSGSDIVIGDEAGRVQLIDVATGAVRSTVELGTPVRTSIVSGGVDEDGHEAFFAVGRAPATLVKIVRSGDELAVAGEAAFTASSTSTPVIVGSRAYIGGVNEAGQGVIAEVDVDTMQVVRVSTVAAAEVKSTPLAISSGGETYLYVTANTEPGALIRYRVSTGEAAVIYEPSGALANYSMASVIADAAGNLYYSNDSGTVFAVGAGAGSENGSGGHDNGGAENGGGTGDNSSSKGSATITGLQTEGAAASSAAPGRGGVIAPGKTPLAQAAASDATASTDDQATAATREGEGANEEAAAVDGTAAAADVTPSRAAAERGWLPLILGAAGIFGLIIAGLWFAAIRRRERTGA